MKNPPHTLVGVIILCILVSIYTVPFCINSKRVATISARKVQNTQQKSENSDDNIDDFQILILEAVFRYMIAHNASAAQMNSTRYYLSFEGKDPIQAVLRRLKDIPVSIDVGSHFSIGKGLAFSARRIHWVNKTQVTVQGGYYEGDENSAGYTITLRLINGKWTGISKEMHWIS